MSAAPKVIQQKEEWWWQAKIIANQYRNMEHTKSAGLIPSCGLGELNIAPKTNHEAKSTAMSHHEHFFKYFVETFRILYYYGIISYGKKL